MSTGQHKAFCVLRFSKCESVKTMQRDFRRRYGIVASTAQSAYIDSLNIYYILKALADHPYPMVMWKEYSTQSV